MLSKAFLTLLLCAVLLALLTQPVSAGSKDEKKKKSKDPPETKNKNDKSKDQKAKKSVADAVEADTNKKAYIQWPSKSSAYYAQSTCQDLVLKCQLYNCSVSSPLSSVTYMWTVADVQALKIKSPKNLYNQYQNKNDKNDADLAGFCAKVHSGGRAAGSGSAKKSKTPSGKTYVKFNKNNFINSMLYEVNTDTDTLTIPKGNLVPGYAYQFRCKADNSYVRYFVPVIACKEATKIDKTDTLPAAVVSGNTPTLPATTPSGGNMTLPFNMSSFPAGSKLSVTITPDPTQVTDSNSWSVSTSPNLTASSSGDVNVRMPLVFTATPVVVTYTITVPNSTDVYTIQATSTLNPAPPVSATQNVNYTSYAEYNKTVPYSSSNNNEVRDIDVLTEPDIAFLAITFKSDFFARRATLVDANLADHYDKATCDNTISCTGHGTCSANTYRLCDCNTGYKGTACEFTTAEFDSYQSVAYNITSAMRKKPLKYSDLTSIMSRINVINTIADVITLDWQSITDLIKLIGQASTSVNDTSSVTSLVNTIGKLGKLILKVAADPDNKISTTQIKTTQKVLNTLTMQTIYQLGKSLTLDSPSLELSTPYISASLNYLRVVDIATDTIEFAMLNSIPSSSDPTTYLPQSYISIPKSIFSMAAQLVIVTTMVPSSSLDIFVSESNLNAPIVEVSVLEKDSLFKYSIKTSSDNPIQISVPVDGDQNTYSCSWFNELTSTFSTTGCESILSDSGAYVNCFCTHLTQFSSQTVVVTGNSATFLSLSLLLVVLMLGLVF